MQLLVDDSSVVVFDLDDTLYKEIDFVRSGYAAVLRSLGTSKAAPLEAMMAWQRAGEPALDRLVQLIGQDPASLGIVDIPEHVPDAAALLTVYRDHRPKITLEPGAEELLTAVRDAGGELAVVTDGRSSSQRGKLQALGVNEWIEVVVVSEEIGSTKPDPANFLRVAATFPDRSRFVYIADNPAKDFAAPNALGWCTIQVDDDGRNVHPQRAPADPARAADVSVAALTEVEVIRRPAHE